MNNDKASCPLCSSTARSFFKADKKEYFRCGLCDGVFLSKEFRLDLDDERSVYEKHENNVEDKGYQKFVSPITSSVMSDFKKDAKGLDFGAGTGPVIAKLLQGRGYDVSLYDPFFHNHPELLEKKYDFIACCEVMEHFHDPYKEFSLLRKLLNRSAKLYCMSEIYNDRIDFAYWYYKNDPTHIFFYTVKTIEWIKKEFGFRDAAVEGRLIIFSS